MDSTCLMVSSGFLTAEERQRFLTLVRRPSGQNGPARRAQALLLLDDGLSFADVARVMFLDDDTVRDWRRKWEKGGQSRLMAFGWRGSRSQMTADQEAQLSQAMSATFFRSTSEVMAYVRQHFGVTYSRSGMIKRLWQLGFEYKKPKGLPRGACVAAQEKFLSHYETLLNTLMPDETVYFVDAVHPQYQTRPAHGWVKKGEKLAVKTTNGRFRLNLHGALCLETGDCKIVEADSICADTTIELVKQILAQNPTMSKIHLIMDNARYHHARNVEAWMNANGQRVKLHFLPAYAPNLNAIEKLWAVMHQQVTHNKFYKTFCSFSIAVRNFFRKTLPRQWPKLTMQISDNFHIINPEKFRVLT
jgi:transposase